MHWLAWRKLCRHKRDGGLGFRVIEDFNTTLLAKQLWRLMDNPESLFAKVFKGRYYRNSSPMDPIRSYSSSYGWQSIISARPLVQKGLIKRVGSGSSISVWYDPWISDSRPRSAICKGFNFYPQLMVSQLINSRSSTWNLPLLHQLFESEEIARITGITIATSSKPDPCGWIFTKTGRYTVKSGYSLLQELTEAEALPVFGPDTRKLQAQSWMVFSNDDQDPRDVLESAITEARAWAAAQTVPARESRNLVPHTEPNLVAEWCQVDGAWKDTDCRVGLGWFNFNPDSGSVLVGACNLRRGLSPLQPELEALAWAMQCMLVHNKRRMNFQTDCADLVKMVSTPRV
ncbi:unnamed protein product [Microthlaspi erraticum]|uniref:RNase H type-1 domain-containing protein n=1 Tax=Microthlaspi erraticum TaxID=1685480 RepID=A0A6D2IE92_9BRAS|nr:unnamed protein product [Microthlaspi erraticum]